MRRAPAVLLAALLAGCSPTLAPTVPLDPSTLRSAPRAALPSGAITGVAPTASGVRALPSDLGAYQAEGGKFRLVRPVRFETKRFGTVVLTTGYLSDGSSSPIADVEGSRMAGFLHDALYAASGHLRFPGGAPATYTKEDADEVYCEEMAKRGVPAWHARANCTGVRSLPHIRAAWQRLTPKRERRFAQWRAKPPLE